MNDDTNIRRENLKRLCKARKLTATSIAAETKVRVSYWADMLREGTTKSFGERAARKLEEKLQLPRGWLDEAGAPIPAPGAESRIAWPFAPDLQRMFLQLDKVERGAAEEILRDRIEKIIERRSSLDAAPSTKKRKQA